MEDENQKTHNELWEAIEFIKSNHIDHLKDDIGEIKITLASHSTDLKWLCKAFWIVLTASVGSFFSALFNLLTK